MYILEVIPIIKGLPLDTLTYYHKEMVMAGDMVSINIGNRKNINALVIDSDEARNRKQSIKSNDWDTKKINHVIFQKVIDSQLLIGIYKAAIKYELPTNTLLSLLFTKKLWDNILKMSIHNSQTIYNTQKEKEEIDLHIYASKKEINKTKDKNIIKSTPCLDALLTHKVNKIILHNTRSRYYVHAHYKLNMLDLIECALSGDRKSVV